MQAKPLRWSGESGSGKTLSCRSVLRCPAGCSADARWIDPLTSEARSTFWRYPRKRCAPHSSDRISMIFRNLMRSLSPLPRPIGDAKSPSATSAPRNECGRGAAKSRWFCSSFERFGLLPITAAARRGRAAYALIEMSAGCAQRVIDRNGNGSPNPSC